MKLLIGWWSIVLAVSLAGSASAVDGVLEINQACAVNGCFSGDDAGLPVTITAAGSYRLTSNLVVPDVNTDAIFVSSNDVGIDLNNFAIIRSGCESSCTATLGTGRGIELASTSLDGISVKNGSVVGTGDTGVWVGANSAVSNVTVRWGGDEGIFASTGSTVSGCRAYQNGGHGIQTSTGSTISGNTAYDNGGDGIRAGIGSTVSGNTAYDNGVNGIYAGNGSTVSGNTAYSNANDGIETYVGSRVSGNTVIYNTAWGLNLTAGAAYSDNVISSNAGGTVSGGVNAGSNVCDGSTTCP